MDPRDPSGPEENARREGSGWRRLRGVAIAAVVVLLPLATWWTFHSRRSGRVSGTRVASEVHENPEAAPAVQASVREGSARGAPQGEPWTRRFVDRLGNPAADPDFYQELFDAGPGALAEVRSRLLDTAALAALRPGDIDAGLVPPALAVRDDGLSLLDALLMHPRSPDPIRAAAAQALADFVKAPFPSHLAPKAFGLELRERGRALASLLREAPDQAVQAWRQQKGSVLRALLRFEARRSLAGEGLPQSKVRSALLALAP